VPKVLPVPGLNQIVQTEITGLSLSRKAAADRRVPEEGVTLWEVKYKVEEVRPQHVEPPAAGRLSEIHVQALIIVGEQDVEIIVKIADTLEKGITGSKKVVSPDTGHHLNMENPEEFNRVVIEFLEQLSESR